MKSKKLKKSIIAISACCAILATGMMSVSAVWTYDTTTLERSASYALGKTLQGYQCRFSGQNDSTSNRNVEFGYYMKDQAKKTTTLYKNPIGPGLSAKIITTDHFPDKHEFYVDMDVLALLTGSYATTETCINSEAKV